MNDSLNIDSLFYRKLQSHKPGLNKDCQCEILVDDCSSLNEIGELKLQVEKYKSDLHVLQEEMKKNEFSNKDVEGLFKDLKLTKQREKNLEIQFGQLQDDRIEVNY